MAAKSDKHLLEAGWILEWRRVFRESLISGNDFGFQPFEPSHPRFREEYLLRCPCCQMQVQALEQKNLIHLQKQLWIGLKVYSDMFQHWNHRLHSDYYELQFMKWLPQITYNSPLVQQLRGLQAWVCEQCVEVGRADLANFENTLTLLLAGSSAPFFYFDYQIKCDTCQVPFLYSREQQHWAYETFVIHSNSYLRNCALCRRAKNYRLWNLRTLQDAISLARAEPTFENLFKASQILLENADSRALDYLRRAKNKAPSLEVRQKLEQQIRIS
jgi:hypothetical protein